VLASATLLFASSLSGGNTGTQLLAALDNVSFIEGVFFLCLPLVAVAFVQRLGLWLAGQPSAQHAPLPARAGASSSALWRIGTLGTLGTLAAGSPATLAVAGLTVAHYAAHPPTPPVIQPEQEAAYAARVPGPNCDPGGAQWASFDYSRLHCESDGLRITVIPNGDGQALFYPPSARFATNYSVSVTVDLTGFSTGCAYLTSRDQDFTDFYVGGYCANGGWFFKRDKASINFGSGTLPGAPPRVTLTVTTHGARQTFAIDGQTLASVDDTTLTETQYIKLDVLDLQGSGGSALLSDFVYTPLSS
jgi:hypothetical protein